MNNKIAIVTGASRGIGRAVALKMIEEGYLVSVVSDNEKELKEAFAHVNQELISLEIGDLVDLKFAEEIVERTFAKWGRIDVLVNNAAWRKVETLRTMSVENWEKTIRICLTTPTFLAKWVASKMETIGQGGVIINMSSVMSDRAGGTGAAYIACKGGLLSLTYEMSALLGPSGIRVVAVSPGNIETQLSQNFLNDEGVNISKELVDDFEDHTPLKRSGQPEEVANLVLWLSGSQASYITGTNIVVDGGFSKNFNSYKLKNLQFPDQF